MNLETFNIYQQEIINKSLHYGLDPSGFAKPNIDQYKMQVAAHALNQGINLTQYIEDFDFNQLNEIRLTIKAKLNIALVAIKGISIGEMQQRRLSQLAVN